MNLSTIPKCGMAVSLLGLGTNNFGERADFVESKAVVHKALDLGTTFSIRPAPIPCPIMDVRNISWLNLWVSGAKTWSSLPRWDC